jgi:hypothetical protein
MVMRMNEQKLFAAALVLGAFALPAQAISFSEAAMGGALDDAGAREAALGGTGATLGRGVAALATNPAGLAGFKGFQLQILGLLQSDDERRSYPVHDSFSGYLADNIYAINTDRQVYPALAAAWAPAARGPAFGISWRPAYVADYSYREEVLSPWRFRSFFPEEVRSDLPGQDVVGSYTDMPLGINELVQDGGVDVFTFSAGFQLFDFEQWGLAVGAGYQYYDGDISMRRSTQYEPVTVINQITGEVAWDAPLLPYDDQSLVVETSGSADAFLGSVRLLLQDRWELVYSYRSSVEMDYAIHSVATIGDSTIVSNDSSAPTYPPLHRFGLVMRPMNMVRTTLGLQIDYEPWEEEGELSSGDPLDNATTYRLGVEHILPGGTPFRFGFTYGTPYTGADHNRVGFTGGTGFDFGPAQIDISGMVAYAAYRTEDIFDDALFGADSRTENDRVEERVFRVVAALNWNF